MSDVDLWDVRTAERFAERVIRTGQATGFRLDPAARGVILTGLSTPSGEVLVAWLDVLAYLSDDTW